MRALVALFASSPALALACGGVFCSAGPNPAPVDQAAEQIIFEVADGRVCAHVTIDYVGDADEFAWIVPVPDTPRIGETDPDVFTTLTRDTNGTVTLPRTDFSQCVFDDGGGSDGGCGCGFNSGLASGGPGPGGDVDAQPPVQVLGREATENYETVTLAAASADDLVEWLADNDYNVSDNMVPVMQPYLDEEMNFVAVKLREGRTAARIQPIAICYRAMFPMIPIRLTAVAAQPLMGIRVFILADHHYVPEGSAELEPDTSAIGFNANGLSSYDAWVARVVDEADGQALVAEFRGNNPLDGPVSVDAGAARGCIADDECPEEQTCLVEDGAVLGLCGVEGAEPPEPVGVQRRLAKVSRYYTRLSPHQMTADPMFVPAPNAPAISGDLDLSEHPSPNTCNGFYVERLASACVFEYCGRDSECVVQWDGSGNIPACACGPGTAAQQITDGSGTPRITCVPKSNPFAVLDEAVDDNLCARLPCGEGVCSLRGGFRTCTCADDAVAVNGRVGVMCVPRGLDAVAYGPGAGAESFPSEEVVASFELRRATPWYGLLLLLALAWSRRRVRRD